MTRRQARKALAGIVSRNFEHAMEPGNSKQHQLHRDIAFLAKVLMHIENRGSKTGMETEVEV